jgi:hypothetical protein
MIDFNKLIDDYVDKEPWTRNVGRYYPSEVGLCMRKTWYSFKCPMKTNADTLKVFEMGKVLHDFIVKVLQSDKIKDVELLESEKPFMIKTDNFIVSGRVDNILLIKASGKKVLAEIKSCDGLDKYQKPHRHNVMQLQLYMHFTGIHNGIMVYIEKNTLKARVFTVDFNKDVVRETLGRFEKLHEHLVNDTIPPAEANMKGSDIGWMCDCCECSERCGKE